MFNGSPHTERGVTVTMLTAFIRGMESAGAEVELRHVYDMDVKPCLGCLSCWHSTPGECV